MTNLGRRDCKSRRHRDRLAAVTRGTRICGRGTVQYETGHVELIFPVTGNKVTEMDSLVPTPGERSLKRELGVDISI